MRMVEEITGRQFGCIRFSLPTGLLLRELVRPYNHEYQDVDRVRLHDLVDRLYLALSEMERDATVEAVDLPVSEEDVRILNAHLCAEEGDWAAVLLHQTRQAFYELRTGSPAVRLADIRHLLQDPPAEKGDPE